MDGGRDLVAAAEGAGGRAATWSRTSLPYVELAVAIICGGLWYVQGGAVWYAGPWPGPLPALLLAAAWGLRGWLLRPPRRFTVFDGAVALFVASAGMGVWAAYDRGPAWAKFWLIVGAIGICYAVARLPTYSHLCVALVFFSLFGAAVAVYFVATNEWDEMAAKVPALMAAGRRLATWLPPVPGHRMHPNVVGGMLVLLAPLGLGLAALGRGDGVCGRRARLRPILFWIGSGSAVVMGVGLILSMSRGAWAAGLVAALCWAAWAAAGRLARRFAAGARSPAWTRIAIALGCLLPGVLVVSGALAFVLTRGLPLAQIVKSRLSVVANASVLARDYIFTGAGLGMFSMQYSIYALLIHVPHTVHSHAMLVGMLIDQGIFGLVAFTLMAAATALRAARAYQRATDTRSRSILEAAVASLIAMLVHGLVDDLYGARALLLLLAPFGLVAAAGTFSASGPICQGKGERLYAARPPGHRRLLAGAGLTAFVALAIIGARRPLLGAAAANLGALEQARVELGTYDPADWQTRPMDAVRREAPLDGAIALLEWALDRAPENRTGRHRLAAIALSRGEYALALRHAEAAWRAGYSDPVTRLLLGDALVANGRIDRAADVVRGLEWGVPRLLGQAWYRYFVAEDFGRAAWASSAVLLLQPENEQAADLLARATAKLKE